MAKSKIINYDSRTKFDHKKADTPKWKTEVYEIEPEKLVLHELANEHPKMTKVKFEAFKENIETYGQDVPVITFRGKIVDGKHRWWALKEIGADKILYTKMPHRSTMEEIKKEIGLSENRRHQTPTQQAIKAYRQGKERGEKFRETERRTEVSHAQLSRCKYIEENLGSKMLDDLWSGKKVSMGARKNISSLAAAVAKHKRIKKEEEQKANRHRRSRESYSPDSDKFYEVIDYLSKLSQEDFEEFKKAVKKESVARAEKRGSCFGR